MHTRDRRPNVTPDDHPGEWKCERADAYSLGLEVGLCGFWSGVRGIPSTVMDVNHGPQLWSSCGPPDHDP